MDLDDVIDRLGRAQHGALTFEQLREADVARHAAARAVERGRLVPVTRKVLRVAGAPRTERHRAAVALLDLGPCAALSRSSASGLWAVPGWRLAPLHVVVVRRRRSSLPEPAIVHTAKDLPSHHLLVVDGLTVTSPARTLFDLAYTLGAEPLERLLERMWALRLVDHASLLEVVDRLGRPGQRPGRILRALVDERGPGYRATESGLEARVRQVLRDAGLAFRQQVVVGADRPIGRVDFLHADQPAILEVQSELYHGGVLAQEADATRRRSLEAAGFVVAEVWEDQVWRRPHEVVAAADRLLDRARRRPAPPSASRRSA